MCGVGRKLSFLLHVWCWKETKFPALHVWCWKEAKFPALRVCGVGRKLSFLLHVWCWKETKFPALHVCGVGRKLSFLLYMCVVFEGTQPQKLFPYFLLVVLWTIHFKPGLQYDHG